MKVKKLKRVILKEEFVAITNSLEGALILAQMCYWSERVYDIDKFLEEECMAYAEETTSSTTDGFANRQSNYPRKCTAR